MSLPSACRSWRSWPGPRRRSWRLSGGCSRPVSGPWGCFRVCYRQVWETTTWGKCHQTARRHTIVSSRIYQISDLIWLFSSCSHFSVLKLTRYMNKSNSLLLVYRWNVQHKHTSVSARGGRWTPSLTFIPMGKNLRRNKHCWHGNGRRDASAPGVWNAGRYESSLAKETHDVMTWRLGANDSKSRHSFKTPSEHSWVMCAVKKIISTPQLKMSTLPYLLY